MRDEVEAAKPSQTLPSSQDKMAMTEYSNNQAVFNCMLNPALKKKKKIPSVLPPPPGVTSEKATTPFWKEPLPERLVHISMILFELISSIGQISGIFISIYDNMT